MGRNMDNIKQISDDIIKTESLDKFITSELPVSYSLFIKTEFGVFEHLPTSIMGKVLHSKYQNEAELCLVPQPFLQRIMKTQPVPGTS